MDQARTASAGEMAKTPPPPVIERSRWLLPAQDAAAATELPPVDSRSPTPSAPPIPRVDAAALDAEPEPPPIQTPSARPDLKRYFLAVWARRWLRRLHSSAAFATSTTVHTVLFVLLALWIIQEQSDLPPLALLAWQPGESAALDRLEVDVFELSAHEPAGAELESQTLNDLAAAPQFGDVQGPSLHEVAVVDIDVGRGTSFDEIGGAASGMFGGPQGVSGLFNESFEGMVDYALDYGLEVVIVFDSTGSMGADIAAVKGRISQIGSNLLKKIPSTRISLCTYRDRGDVYVVKGIPLTNDLRTLQTFLDLTTAGGGGDYPEAVDAGLEWAIGNNKFRRAARKVILIFGDAPPHAHNLADCVRMADEFHRYQQGVVTTITVRKARPLEEFDKISKLGGGSSFAMQDTRLLMEELVVQVFGPQHRDKAVKFFGLDKMP
jgi:hypothetical protein